VNGYEINDRTSELVSMRTAARLFPGLASVLTRLAKEAFSFSGKPHVFIQSARC
jgi:hypothetical protein